MMLQRLTASALMAATWLFAADTPPKEWIDPETGHRVVRLTDEPGSASLYFNQNGYTPDGKGMLYTSPAGIHVLNLATRETRLLVKGRARLIDAGRKSSYLYFTRDGAVFQANTDTGQERKIATLPPRGGIATVNADETLLAGTAIVGEGTDFGLNRRPPAPSTQAHPLDQAANKGQMMEDRWAAKLPMRMFTVNIQTGEIRDIHHATDWLNHLLFSPTDPTLLMFCHEGPWHKVDRIWTIRTDGTQLKKIHTRTMAMEIFGHEFWSPDGRTIWYDLQTPRGEDFWLSSYRVETGARHWYHLQRDEWSIHFNVTPDGTMMCGDGGDPGQVAKAKNGQWIYLFRPEPTPDRGLSDPRFVQTGVLRAEKLVNMAKHQYRLEPNVSFTPDQKWVVFRSNMFGDTYVFAVSVDKAQ